MKRNFSDWGIKGGACALAVLLWFHAVTEHTYQKEIDIRLQVEGIPPDLSAEELMVANVLPSRVRVLVSGRGKDLLSLKEDGFFLRVQPRGNSPGSVYSYRLSPDQVENLAVGADVQVRKIVEPREIEVEIDKRSEWMVDVEAVLDLEIAEAYKQIGRVRIDPPQVKFTGPSKRLQKIKSIHTDSLVLRDVHEDVDLQVGLRPPEGIRLELSPDTVRVRIEVQELAEFEIAEVPVQVHNGGGRNIQLEPARVRVRVRGGADIIGRLKPEQVYLYVEYREENTGGGLSVQARPDSSFEVIALGPSRVEVAGR
ncbi:MAG: YbbR-like domain-containing protein [Candidatus Latescibacteria bacterium]|nr:YbbR-like domain-containing protein [Candidatus Latescibacterota bacterium]